MAEDWEAVQTLDGGRPVTSLSDNLHDAMLAGAQLCSLGKCPPPGLASSL